jgi:hypothetical protein
MGVNRRAPKEQDVSTPPAGCDVGIEKFKKHDVAIDALISGETITNAALIAGVRRETLSRWLHDNPVFIAQKQPSTTRRRTSFGMRASRV